jgi:hypothetical protein
VQRLIHVMSNWCGHTQPVRATVATNRLRLQRPALMLRFRSSSPLAARANFGFGALVSELASFDPQENRRHARASVAFAVAGGLALTRQSPHFAWPIAILFRVEGNLPCSWARQGLHRCKQDAVITRRFPCKTRQVVPTMPPRVQLQVLGMQLPANRRPTAPIAIMGARLGCKPVLCSLHTGAHDGPFKTQTPGL